MAWLKLGWFKRHRPDRTLAASTPVASGHPTEQPSGADAVPQGARTIVMYGTPWCGDCRRAHRVFAELAVAYAYVDIEDDPDAAALVMRLNDGVRTVPTILFPDGSVLAEPDSGELAEKLAAFTV